MDYTVINPSTEEPIEIVRGLSRDETDQAIDHAVRAQAKWLKVSPGDRAKVLRRFANAVEDQHEELALLEVVNSGHPISNARAEAEQVSQVLHYYSSGTERLLGKQIPVAGGMNVTFHEPFGVVGVITPWNFPMTSAIWGVAPALAAGNAVLVKPAELTPLTTLKLAELGLEAGLPEYLFQVLPGKGSIVGDRFVTHPSVRKIVFTGSTEIGINVMSKAASHVKDVTLELGGKSANIVFSDASVREAAEATPSSIFDNSGQDCCARSRLLVQESIYEEFMERLEVAVREYKVCDPMDETSQMGPLISKHHLKTVKSFVPDDVSIAFQGTSPQGRGFWFPPTVINSDVSDVQFTDEIFGPVLSVVRFKNEDEAIRIANDTPYGLSGSIWTNDLSRAVRVSRAVESGNLSVNSHSSVRYSTPFGGFKHSGLGRELGPDAVHKFTEEKNVFFAIG